MEKFVIQTFNNTSKNRPPSNSKIRKQTTNKGSEKKLKEAYETEEANLILENTKRLEQKYFRNQHAEAWKIVKELYDTPTINRKELIGTPANHKEILYDTFSDLLGTSSTSPIREPIKRVIQHTLSIDTSNFRWKNLIRPWTRQRNALWDPTSYNWNCGTTFIQRTTSQPQ